MEDRYTLVEDSNSTYLVTRVSGPEGGHPSGWDGRRLGPGTGGDAPPGLLRDTRPVQGISYCRGCRYDHINDP